MAILGGGIISNSFNGSSSGGGGSVITGGATTFLDLTDTPNTYAGQAYKIARVKSNETGLEFISSDSGTYVVFKENFVGNGVASTFTLNGSIQNGSFLTGSWNLSNIQNTLPTNITNNNGSPIYDGNIYFFRNRINVVSVSGIGLVTLDYIPQNGADVSIWYWYKLSSSDKLQNYYREDFVASMEDAVGGLATQVYTNTTNFNNILGSVDTTVQLALDTLDNVAITKTSVALISSGLQSQISNNFNKFNDYTLITTTSVISAGLQSQINSDRTNYTLNSTTALISAGLTNRLNGINIIAGSNVTVNKTFDNVYTISSVAGGGTSFTPIAGSGITITAPTSSSYLFSVTDYISKTEAASISSGLTNRIRNVENNYTLNSTTSAISAGLQTQISNNFNSLNNYTLNSTTSAISAGLSNRIGNIEANYALNSTTALISAGLQNQITNNLNKLNDYTLNTTSSVISAGLSNRIGNVENNYTLNSTTALISAGLTNRLNGINIIAGSNITVNKTFDNVYTISSAGTGGGTGFTPIAGNGITITAPTSSSYLFSVTDYISKTEVAGISAGLQSQIGIAPIKGKQALNNITDTYSISHSNVNILTSYIQLTLEIPSNNSTQFPISVNNRQSTSFDIVTSTIPPVTGYSVYWQVLS